MKRIIIILIIPFFTQCAQLYFSKPQPSKGMAIRHFEKDLQGYYSDSLMSLTIMNDFLVVDTDTFVLNSKTPGEGEVLVKYYNDFYFANFRDSLYFSVFMGKFYDDKLAVYMLNADERSIDVLRRFMDVEVLDEEKEYYLADPSKKEFQQLVENELFDVVSVLQRSVLPAKK